MDKWYTYVVRIESNGGTFKLSAPCRVATIYLRTAAAYSSSAGSARGARWNTIRETGIASTIYSMLVLAARCCNIKFYFVHTLCAAQAAIISHNDPIFEWVAMTKRARATEKTLTPTIPNTYYNERQRVGSATLVLPVASVWLFICIAFWLLKCVHLPLTIPNWTALTFKKEFQRQFGFSLGSRSLQFESESNKKKWNESGNLYMISELIGFDSPHYTN